MDQLTTLLEMIKETIKINNRFLERFLEKKGFYNFRRKYSGSGKKYKDPIELDAIYKKP
jgi:predicted RNA binding protein YcfA (HicA-like mRNA interferase family)